MYVRNCPLQSKVQNRKELPTDYVLLTIHRPENVDDENNLKLLMTHFQSIDYNIVFPIHPRTKNNLLKYNIQIPSNIILIEPVGYIEFLSLLMRCRLVLTDSGGCTRRSNYIKKTLYHT